MEVQFSRFPIIISIWRSDPMELRLFPLFLPCVSYYMLSVLAILDEFLECSVSEVPFLRFPIIIFIWRSAQIFLRFVPSYLPCPIYCVSEVSASWDLIVWSSDIEVPLNTVKWTSNHHFDYKDVLKSLKTRHFCCQRPRITLEPLRPKPQMLSNLWNRCAVGVVGVVGVVVGRTDGHFPQKGSSISRLGSEDTGLKFCTQHNSHTGTQ